MIPIIRPFFYKNKFVTDFNIKCINAFFTKQCSLIDNNSNVDQNLDPNKACDHDQISASVTLSSFRWNISFENV